MKTYKYRIYPTKKQENQLEKALYLCKSLYNKTLKERITSFKNKIKLSKFDQIKSLTELRKDNEEYKKIYAQILQNVIIRVDNSFKHFFRRCKLKENPGYPRFKNLRYPSITYPQLNSNYKIIDNKLTLPKIGKVKIIYHRELEGIPKTLTLKKFPTGKWFAFISCDKVPKKLIKKTGLEEGLDLGLTTFAVLSDGNKINRERFFKNEEIELKKNQRKLDKLKKKEKYYRKQKRRLARIHERIINKRDNFTHQASKKLIDQYDILVIEGLDIKEMMNKDKNKTKKTSKRIRKSIQDVSWGEFINKLSYKAESAGKKVIKINPKNTSKTCSKCLHVKDNLNLQDRVYKCSHCGISIDRDLNASINIKRLGLQSLVVNSV